MSGWLQSALGPSARFRIRRPSDCDCRVSDGAPKLGWRSAADSHEALRTWACYTPCSKTIFPFTV